VPVVTNVVLLGDQAEAEGDVGQLRPDTPRKLRGDGDTVGRHQGQGKAGEELNLNSCAAAGPANRRSLPEAKIRDTRRR